MNTPLWTPDLHDAAMARADMLRQQALDALFSALGGAWMRWLGASSHPEA